MLLQLIEVRARHVLQEAGVWDVDVYVSEHRETVQVLFSMQLAPTIADKVQAALRASNPGVVFDFVLP